MSSIEFLEFYLREFFIRRLSLPECVKIPVLVLADSQIQSSPFACLLTVCRVFSSDETLLWAGRMYHRGEGRTTPEENTELLSQVVARRDWGCPPKTHKMHVVVVQLCTRVHVHGLNLHLSEDFTVDFFALSWKIHGRRTYSRTSPNISERVCKQCVVNNAYITRHNPLRKKV